MTMIIEGSGITYPDATKQTVAPYTVLRALHRVVGDNAGPAAAGNNIRTLNTLARNTIPGASLNGSNQVILPAGTYRISGYAVAYAVNNCITFVSNASTSVVLVSSAGTYSDAPTGSAQVHMPFDGEVTLTAQTILQVVTYCSQAKVSNGLGVTGGSAGVPNVYVNLLVEKVG